MDKQTGQVAEGLLGSHFENTVRVHDQAQMGTTWKGFAPSPYKQLPYKHAQAGT